MLDLGKQADHQMDETKNLALQAALIEALNGEGNSCPPRPDSFNGRGAQQNRDEGGEAGRKARPSVKPPPAPQGRITISSSAEIGAKPDEWADIIEGMVSGSKVHDAMASYNPSGDRQLQQQLSGKANTKGFVLKPWHVLLTVAFMLFGSFLWNVIIPIIERALFNSILT